MKDKEHNQDMRLYHDGLIHAYSADKACNESVSLFYNYYLQYNT